MSNEQIRKWAADHSGKTASEMATEILGVLNEYEGYIATDCDKECLLLSGRNLQVLKGIAAGKITVGDQLLGQELCQILGNAGSNDSYSSSSSRFAEYYKAPKLQLGAERTAEQTAIRSKHYDEFRNDREQKSKAFSETFSNLLNECAENGLFTSGNPLPTKAIGQAKN